MDKPIILSKYEFARIKGVRIQQLTDGFPPKIDVEDTDTIEDIFEKEFMEGKTPLMIKRQVGFNRYIDIPIKNCVRNKYH
jgi:DNA-directed RNA polymerase subunit K/omega